MLRGSICWESGEGLLSQQCSRYEVRCLCSAGGWHQGYGISHRFVLPGCAHNREHVAVQSDVASDLPRQHQQDGEYKEYRVGAGRPCHHEVPEATTRRMLALVYLREAPVSPKTRFSHQTSQSGDSPSRTTRYEQDFYPTPFASPQLESFEFDEQWLKVRPPYARSKRQNPSMPPNVGYFM